jgi:hypothetical protein
MGFPRGRGKFDNVRDYQLAWNKYNIVDLTLKGKAILLQVWTGPEGSRSLRLPDFKIIST